MSSIFGDVCWLLEDLAFTARYKGMNLINRFVFPQPKPTPRYHDMYRFNFFDGPEADKFREEDDDYPEEGAVMIPSPIVLPPIPYWGSRDHVPHTPVIRRRPQVVSPRGRPPVVKRAKSTSSPRSTSPTASTTPSTTPSTSTSSSSSSTISSTPSRPLMASGRPSLATVSPTQSTTALAEMAPTALATFSSEVREKRIKRFIHDATATRIINHEEIVIIVKLEGMKRVGGPKPKRKLWFW
ncbi:hypothetical protein T439DRAFT_359260 [Meredithblackwellia eburnea MCA 4105]